MKQPAKDSLARWISSELIKREMTKKELQDALVARFGEEGAVHYNHVCNITSGKTFPGTNLLRRICEILDIPFEEAQQLCLRDKAMAKGVAQILMPESDAELLEIQNLWRYLGHKDKRELVGLARMKAEMAMSK